MSAATAWCSGPLKAGGAREGLWPQDPTSCGSAAPQVPFSLIFFPCGMLF